MGDMDSPMVLARKLEGRVAASGGRGERLGGYGVMGLSFTSGHLLAFRRMVASSIGPPYTSVWHRAPDGVWTFYVDVDPRESCPRYFGSALDRVVEGEIGLSWESPSEVSLVVPDARLQWAVRLSADALTRGVTALGRLLPDWAAASPLVLSGLGGVASRLLELGPLGLTGRAPNGQRFLAVPRLVWRVEAGAAVLDGEELGGTTSLEERVALGDFRIPSLGVFVFGDARFERFDRARHSEAIVRPGGRTPWPSPLTRC